MLERQNSEIEWLGKFKDERGSDLFTFVSKLRRKMTTLEKQIAENNQIADTVLIQIKTLFNNVLVGMQEVHKV